MFSELAASCEADLYVITAIKYLLRIRCLVEDCRSELEAIKKVNWSKFKVETGENIFILQTKLGTIFVALVCSWQMETVRRRWGMMLRFKRKGSLKR